MLKHESFHICNVIFPLQCRLGLKIHSPENNYALLEEDKIADKKTHGIIH